MFNSLLNDVSVDAMILDVFIILGVVIAASLVVYLLWEAVSAIINKNKTSEELNLGENKNLVNDNSVVLDYSLDAKPEETLIDESKIEEVNEVQAEEEKTEVENETSEEERSNAERRAYLEARRQELIRRMQESSAQEEEATEEVEETEEVAEEIVEEETVEEQKEEVAEDVDTLAEERQALAEEKARYETMVKELEEAKKAVEEAKKEMENVEPVVVPVVTNGVLSLEELKAKLAETEEKLRNTEKEFRQCKKEYIPLRKVWSTHEKDEKKLRRKEALVAKQKVLLYGVNNYADIDEEKAKKLAEDLDLLDGLKLSVQHCEEVMKKNEERYPLLERMYNVLKARNDELKADIAYYREEIDKLENEQGEEEN